LIRRNLATKVAEAFRSISLIDSRHLMVMTDGTVYRLITDHLGSVWLVVNAATGEVVQRMDYDAFGRVLEDTNPGFQSFGFAGGLYDDDSGLLRFGARDYDAYSGRWTAKDLLLFDDGANLYVYAGSDPINFVDPEGTDALDIANALDDSALVDYAAGIGDALLLGFGDELRYLSGGGGAIDECSTAYRAGAWTSFVFGVGRLGYAAAAKAISIGASSGAAASAGREAIKNWGRFGLAKDWRKFDPAGKSDAVLRAGAGKTNFGVNAYGAGVAAAGAYGGSGCGCP